MLAEWQSLVIQQSQIKYSGQEYIFFLILQERFDERQKSADDRHLFLASLTDRKGLRRQVGT